MEGRADSEQVVLGNKIDVEESKRVVNFGTMVINWAVANPNLDFQQACHDLLPVQGRHPILRDQC